MKYADLLEGQGVTAVPALRSATLSTRGSTKLKMGWALKTSEVKRTRFTTAQRSYLSEKFKLGELTKHKADPTSIARSMRRAKDVNGARMFSAEEFLTATHVAGYFSRLASKKTLAHNDVELDFIESATREETIHEMVGDAISELSLQHPVIYDCHNLCELASKGKLGSFALAVLRDMCTHLGIDVRDIKIKRRQPYVDRVQALCNMCSCKQ